MFCVICGRQLTDSNQHGLICRCCHDVRVKHKLLREQISVKYCYICGGFYAPHDTSIQHRTCAWLSLHQTAAVTQVVLVEKGKVICYFS